MRLNWNIKLLTSLAALSLLVTGCGGLTASKSISPASFFLPGIMQVVPDKPNTITPAPGDKLAPVHEVASLDGQFEVQ